MAKKKVIRTYFNKKLNKYVTKTYEYNAKKYAKTKRTGRDLLLVGEHGKKYQDRIDKLLNKIQNPATKFQVQAKINAFANNKEKLTERSLLARVERDKAKRLLVNLGYTVDEFERDYGIKFSDFSDPNNWSGDVVTISGISYQLIWDYYNPVLKRI